MRKIVSKSGERLFKAVHVRIFLPENKRAINRVHRAPAGRVISPEGIDEILADVAEKIEKQWPTEEYSLVQTGLASFNFVWRKKKMMHDEAAN